MQSNLIIASSLCLMVVGALAKTADGDGISSGYIWRTGKAKLLIRGHIPVVDFSWREVTPRSHGFYGLSIYLWPLKISAYHLTPESVDKALGLTVNHL